MTNYQSDHGEFYQLTNTLLASLGKIRNDTEETDITDVTDGESHR